MRSGVRVRQHPNVLQRARPAAPWPSACRLDLDGRGLFGVNAEAETLDEMRAKLPDIVRDMIDANEPDLVGRDVDFEDRCSDARPCHCSMKGYGKLVRAKLLENGCWFVRYAKADHDVWFS